MNDFGFFERQQKYASNKENQQNNGNINNPHNMRHQVDPLTGQELFKPVTGRPPKKHRNA